MNPFPFCERAHVAFVPLEVRPYVHGRVIAAEPARLEVGPRVAFATVDAGQQSLPGAVRADTNDQAERALADLRAILDDDAATRPLEGALF